MAFGVDRDMVARQTPNCAENAEAFSVALYLGYDSFSHPPVLYNVV